MHDRFYSACIILQANIYILLSHAPVCYSVNIVLTLTNVVHSVNVMLARLDASTE